MRTQVSEIRLSHEPVAIDAELLREQALADAASWKPAGKVRRWAGTSQLRAAAAAIEQALAGGGNCSAEERRWLTENARLLRTAIREVERSARGMREHPHVVAPDGSAVPRAYVAAQSFLSVTEGRFDEQSLGAYLGCLEEAVELEMGEIWAVRPMLQAVLLERIVEQVSDPPVSKQDGRSETCPTLITSLRAVGEANWKDLFEAVSAVERILRSDPAGAYAGMEYESRDLYRQVVADLAARSDAGERQVAEAVGSPGTELEFAL